MHVQNECIVAIDTRLCRHILRISIGILVQDIISLCDCSNVVIAETANKISQI